MSFSTDWKVSTYSPEVEAKKLPPLLRSVIDLAALGLDERLLAAGTEHYMGHRFDLLGSGWVRIEHGMGCRGLHGHRYPQGPAVAPDPEGSWLEGRINPGNLPRAREIWRLVDPEYRPIDWQLDFKSGYRWSERSWHLHVSLDAGPGTDVKVPWELARMQHLVQLAWAFGLARQGVPGFRDAEDYAREFRNQILDFCAANPPRFGVNWRCTMDVAIRVANWVMAYELFRVSGAAFDPAFEKVLAASVFDHGHHIVNHLEWFEHGRGNHYLANVSGLIFAAAALPEAGESIDWIKFAAAELVKEVEHQFHLDGTGAEASTAYHCLCAEMVGYATAVLLGLPAGLKSSVRQHLEHSGLIERNSADALFPDWYGQRVERMAEFVMTITKPGGAISQIGDNDSGRFFRMFLQYSEKPMSEAKSEFEHLQDFPAMSDEERYLVDDCLDRRHVVAALSGLVPRADFKRFSGTPVREAEVIAGLAGSRVLRPEGVSPCAPGASRMVIGTSESLERGAIEWESAAPARRTSTRLKVHQGSDAGPWQTFGFPDFGLYVFRNKGIYVSVRCGAMGKNVLGAHAHNDQLSLEYNVDGEDRIADPGTYLYTPVPEARNQYRSVSAHFAPQAVDFEPASLNEHLFYLDFDHPGECLYFGSQGFFGRHQGPGFAFYRTVTLGPTEITVRDWSTSHELVPMEKFQPIQFSPGYGMRQTLTGPQTSH